VRIVIAGAGEVGFQLIENLYRQDIEISVVDTDAGVLEKLKNEFEVHSDHCNIIDSKFLSESYLKDIDLFLAITNSDETNMIACKKASEAGAKRTICRIRQIDFSRQRKDFTLKSLGIDWIINPVSLVADALYSLVLTPNIMDNHRFSGGRITLTGYKMRSYSRLLGQSIGALEEGVGRDRFYIGIIQRKDLFLIPQKTETIQEDDVVYFFYRTRDFQLLRRILGYDQIQSRANRVFINGGGHIGLRLATMLEKAHQNVKLIERDIARSYHVAEKLRQSLVLNFDGTDLGQLVAEGIENADNFIAVTDNEQVNITSCLHACNQGVRRTICLVKQPELIPIIAQNTPISLGISPRTITGRYLVRFIQDANVHSYFAISGSHMEVLEIRIGAGTPCLNRPLKDIRLPENVRIGAIQRGDDFLVPDGHNTLLQNDAVLLILHQLDRQAVMQFFNPPEQA